MFRRALPSNNMRWIKVEVNLEPAPALLPRLTSIEMILHKNTAKDRSETRDEQNSVTSA
jgi:hypothetical protein